MLDAKLCRTCQKVIDKKDGSAKLDEVDPGTEITLRTKLHVCVPELMLADSNEDVICMICTNMLNLSYMFRNICIKTEQTRHNSLSIPAMNTKIKKETVPDDTGIIVTRLQNPAMKKERRSSRHSPAAASTTKSPRRSEKARSEVVNEATETPKAPRSSEEIVRDRKGRYKPSRSRNKAINSSSNAGRREDVNGVQDEGLGDGNNQEPLLEIAYEESVGASDIDRFSTTSDYSIGSLRDIPEVIVRDPNTNIAPGGRTLRTRQNVSYVMPPDSPETVQKTDRPKQTSSAVTVNNQSALSSSGSVEKGVTEPEVGSKGRRSIAVTANGGGKSKGSAGGEGKQISPGHKSKLLTNASLADVDVIDDFCRRSNRDPLEFLCSVPVLKCNSDIGRAAPARGIMPVIDNIQCDLCGQQLSRFQGLRRHRLRHFANYKFCCEICGRKVFERYEMREHFELKHNITPDLITKYIEKSQLTDPQSKYQYRILNSKADLSQGLKTTNSTTTNNQSSKRSRSRGTSQQPQTSKRSRSGGKVVPPEPEPPVVPTYNRPGPKSSKIATVPPLIVELPKNKPGPKSSKAKPKTPQVVEVAVVSSAPKASPRMTNNSRNIGGNIHLELKRRRMPIASPPVVSPKRKRVAAVTSVGTRFKYECIFCDVLVSDKETLRLHLKHYHCNVCFKFFVGKSTKNAHHCLHVPQKVEDENFYLCLDCDDYKSKLHFPSHLDASKSRKLDQLFTVNPKPTYDSHSVEDRRRIVPTMQCNLGKMNQECFFFCGDPDALKFHQVRVHSLTKLLQQITPEKLTTFEALEKQIRPGKVQTQAATSSISSNLSATLQDLQMINYVEDFVDVEALDPPDTDVDPMADVGTERCATCAEEMPNGPLEHECGAHTSLLETVTAVASIAPPASADEVYKCEICLNSFDRLSLIDHMKVHMNSTVM